MPSHYGNPARGFALFDSTDRPAWRPPQRGALGALLGHWSVHRRRPGLIAIPTGAGKTALATALPYLVRAQRVLVLVPSKQLRTQIADAFHTQADLRQVGAVTDLADPRVLEVRGRVRDWAVLLDFDVIVALPDSISPAHYAEPSKPPVDLFDLIVVDEAHHAPAPTWRAVLDHFSEARKALLTATPRRRDGQRVPGEVVYHYPLRSAIAEGFYRAVTPVLINVADPSSRSQCDRAIRDEVASLFKAPEHATSTLLIRVSERKRIKDVIALYAEAGIEVVGLTSDLGEVRRTQIIEGLKDGSIRAVAVVGMLSEGFDLPRLRLAAYHDKHKSLSATVQLIGRLVRSHPDFPQPSVLVTVKDADAYPGLRDALWDLYQEDADWSNLLPSIIDDQVEEHLKDKAFTEQLEKPPAQLSLESLHPVVRATVFEVRDAAWRPDFVDSGVVPSGLERGAQIRGQQVFYATVTPNRKTFLLVSQAVDSPRWNADPGLDTASYDLHLISYVAEDTTHALLLVNSSDSAIRQAIMDKIGATTQTLRTADPQRLQDSFDDLPRVSVSNVGVRNTYAGGRGRPSYKMFAGSNVDSGMREADTAQGALGHAMAQVNQGDGRSSYTTGVAVEKSKFWESRYVPLRTYEDVLDAFSLRYWKSTRPINPLLPAVTRGSRLGHFPDADAALVELNQDLIGSAWQLADGLALDRLDLRPVNGSSSSTSFVIEAVNPETGATVWSGRQDLLGVITDTGQPLIAHRGRSNPRSLSDLLTALPPAIYFLDGQTIQGAVVYSPLEVQRDLTRWTPRLPNWSGTNITKETDKSAAKAGQGVSVHQALRTLIKAQPLRGRRRWILENDGSGELADLIVLELLDGPELHLELWHAKPSSSTTPAARVTDMQVVTAQAIKSRRWLTDRSLWTEMRDRYTGKSTPRLLLVDGSERLLRVALGLVPGRTHLGLMHQYFLLRGRIVIAQPGLSWRTLEVDLAGEVLAATQIRDLLAVFDDALGALAESHLVCSN